MEHVALLALSLLSACASPASSRLAFSAANSLTLLPAGDAAQSTLSLPSLTSVGAMAADGTGGLFMADYRGDEADTSLLWLPDTSSSSNLTLLSGVPALEMVSGLAFDPRSSSLLVADSRRGAVFALRLAAAGDYNRVESWDKLATFEGGEKPRGIAVDTCSGSVFWAVDSRRDPRIERSSIDGSRSAEVVASLRRGDRPRSVSVRGGRLFWASQTRSGRGVRIESSDPDGAGRGEVCSAAGHAVFDLAVDAEGEEVSWTDGRNMAVWSAAAGGGADKCSPRLVAKSPSRPLGIASLATSDRPCEALESAPPASCGLACLNGGNCSLNGDGTSVCLCPEGFAGALCQERTRAGCREGFCRGGGICAENEGVGPLCRCPPGLKGSRCDQVDLLVGSLPDETSADHSAATSSPEVVIFLSVLLGVAATLVFASACLMCFKRRSSTPGGRGSAAGSPQPYSPVVSSAAGEKRRRPRTFSASLDGGLKTVSEGVVVDLEDCCKMTICDKPCVEWSSRTQPPRKGLGGQARAAAVSICSPHKSPIRSQQQQQDQASLLSEDALAAFYPD